MHVFSFFGGLAAALSKATLVATGLQGDPSQQLAEQWFAQGTSDLMDQRGLFERLRLEYFFINANPENDARIDVTFETAGPPGWSRASPRLRAIDAVIDRFEPPS